MNEISPKEFKCGWVENDTTKNNRGFLTAFHGTKEQYKQMGIFIPVCDYYAMVCFLGGNGRIFSAVNANREQSVQIFQQALKNGV